MDEDKIIYLNFWDKSKFQNDKKQEWEQEPDFLFWRRYGLSCLAIRNQETGVWRGLVGISESHRAYGKSLEQLSEEKWFRQIRVHNGISFAGIASDFGTTTYWIGFECNASSDLLPIDFGQKKKQSKGKYRNFAFVRGEIVKLARQLAKVGEANEKENK